MTAALTRRMADAAGPSAVLTGLADAIRDAVPVNSVSVVLTSGDRDLLRVTRGIPDGAEVTSLSPLTFQGAELGRVETVGYRPMDRADRSLLADLAAAASAALAAAHRSSELQRARQELITAREQERRRIARDLHDGVGPVLSGLGFTLDTLRSSVHDPAALVVAGQARGQVRDAVQLVRRVARELRPPGVDQLGLIGALRELAAQHTVPGLTVQFAAGDLGELDAATEVATHAIVAEALTNAARHARASQCRITLDRGDDGVTVVVEDDGAGLGEAPAGVGCTSMVERADELGGWCRIISKPAGGTTVTAHLPAHTPDHNRNELPFPSVAVDAAVR
jgi:signal transduction histidine kinase